MSVSLTDVFNTYNLDLIKQCVNLSPNAGVWLGWSKLSDDEENCIKFYRGLGNIFYSSEGPSTSH